MNNIKMLHLSSWDNIKINQDYSTPNTFSNYWVNKISDKTLLEKNWLDFSQELERLCPDVTSIMSNLGKIVNESKYKLELLKEYVFEEIRNDEFPEKPSRRKCMFGFPENFDIIKIRSIFSLKREIRPYCYKIQTLETSNWFLTDAKLLNCNTFDIYEIKKMARAYWSGTNSPEMPEILLEGNYRIIEIVSEV